MVRINTCICMAEPLCCSPETITTLLISYTPTPKKSSKIKKKTHSGKKKKKNLPCNVGNSGLIPGWGTKIPHAVEQASP